MSMKNLILELFDRQFSQNGMARINLFSENEMSVNNIKKNLNKSKIKKTISN